MLIRASMLVSLTVGIFAGVATGGEVKEVAVFPEVADAKKSQPVHAMQFSTDGSRLLTAGGFVVQDPSNPKKTTNQLAFWVIWDVAKKQPVAFSPGGGLHIAQLSVDGRYVISPGPSMWDGASGKELRHGALDGTLLAACTAQALSADSAYLAVGLNEQLGKSKGTLAQFRVGTIGVWDLKARKMKWRLPGVEEEAENRVDRGMAFRNPYVKNLAFAPDGSKLAAVMGKQLRIFALEAGKDVPTLTITADLKDLTAGAHVEFQWLPDGKAMLLRNDTGMGFEFLDAATGKRKDKFELKAPTAPQPAPAMKAKPGGVPKATGGSSNDDAPARMSFGASLSPDAKWLVALEGREAHEVVIAIWDVAARRRRAILRLPEDDFTRKESIVAGGPSPDYVATAISPNGKQLAVADRFGVVHVYDVAQIEALAKNPQAKPGTKAPPAGDDSLTVGSIWNGEKHRDQGNTTTPAVLKITERDGAAFKGEFTFDQENISAIEGTCTDGKIEWHTTKALQGEANQPTAGTFKDNAINAKFHLVVRNGKKTNTTSGTIKLTKSAGDTPETKPSGEGTGVETKPSDPNAGAGRGADRAEGEAAKYVEGMGGQVTRDKAVRGNPVVGVDLHGAFLTDELTNTGWKKLTAFKRLRTLNLSGTKLDDGDLKKLAALKSLQELNLQGTHLTDAGLKELTALPQLRELHVDGTVVTDAGLKDLAALPELATLDLRRTRLTGAGLKELAELKTLRTLDLGGTKVTDAGLKELSTLKTLQSLNLAGTPVTDAGLKEVATIKTLRELNVSYTKVGDAGLKELAELKSLETLHIESTHVTLAGRTELRQALPKCRILGP